MFSKSISSRRVVCFHGAVAPFVEAQGSTAAGFIIEDDGVAGSSPVLVNYDQVAQLVEHVASLSRLSFLRFDERR